MQVVAFATREETLPQVGRWFVGVASGSSIVVYQSLPREIAKAAVMPPSVSANG